MCVVINNKYKEIWSHNLGETSKSYYQREFLNTITNSLNIYNKSGFYLKIHNLWRKNRQRLFIILFTLNKSLWSFSVTMPTICQIHEEIYGNNKNLRIIFFKLRFSISNSSLIQHILHSNNCHPSTATAKNILINHVRNMSFSLKSIIIHFSINITRTRIKMDLSCHSIGSMYASPQWSYLYQN